MSAYKYSLQTHSLQTHSLQILSAFKIIRIPRFVIDVQTATMQQNMAITLQSNVNQCKTAGSNGVLNFDVLKNFLGNVESQNMPGTPQSINQLQIVDANGFRIGNLNDSEYFFDISFQDVTHKYVSFSQQPT